jgi:hypothetical protein
MRQCFIVYELFRKPLCAKVSHLVLLHVQFAQSKVFLQHYRIVLRYFVHPTRELVLRHWTVDVQRLQSSIVVQHGRDCNQTLDFLENFVK